MSEKSILPQTWSVPEELRKRVGKRAGRQRHMRADGHLLLILHAPPKGDEPERQGRYFWRNPSGAWMSNEFGSGIGALNKHLDQFEDLLANLDRSEEQAKTAEEYFDVLSRVTPLHRSARNLHRVLQDARTECPDCPDLIDLRDRAYAIERSAELLFEGTKQSLDFIVALRAEEQAKASLRMEASAYRLNLLAAIFFPLLTVASILGVDLLTLSALLGQDTETLIASGRLPLIFLICIVLGMVAGGLLTKLAGSGKRPG